MFPDNCGHWTLTMPLSSSLPACPYAGRSIAFDLNILWDYPNSSPAIVLTTPILHPHFVPGERALFSLSINLTFMRVRIWLIF